VNPNTNWNLSGWDQHERRPEVRRQLLLKETGNDYLAAIEVLQQIYARSFGVDIKYQLTIDVEYFKKEYAKRFKKVVPVMRTG